MRWSRTYLQDLVLIAAANMVAAHVLLAAVPFFVVRAEGKPLPGEQIVLCSSHGLMVLDADGSPLPLPARSKPACTWCLVNGKPDWDLTPIGPRAAGLLPPLLLHSRMRAAASEPFSPLLRSFAFAPRGPPSLNAPENA
jgi:hypothetical protein